MVTVTMLCDGLAPSTCTVSAWTTVTGRIDTAEAGECDGVRYQPGGQPSCSQTSRVR